jgi:hypothetical protein
MFGKLNRKTSLEDVDGHNVTMESNISREGTSDSVPPKIRLKTDDNSRRHQRGVENHNHLLLLSIRKIKLKVVIC